MLNNLTLSLCLFMFKKLDPNIFSHSFLLVKKDDGVISSMAARNVGKEKIISPKLKKLRFKGLSRKNSLEGNHHPS